MAVHPPKRFPYSIVWTPIPVLSWVAPFIGHVGICTSDGVIFDFAGPYHISVDNLAFGHPTRYVQLNPWQMMEPARQSSAATPASPASRATSPKHSVPGSPVPSQADLAAAWDEALQAAADMFTMQDYAFMGNNCHCFVAHFLNSIRYQGFTRWGTVRIATYVFLHGRCVSPAACAKTFLPFILLLPLSAILGGLIMLFIWLALLASMVACFMACNSRSSPNTGKEPA